MKPSQRLINRANTLYRHVFPRLVELSDEIKDLLGRLYPTLDLNKIRYYEGLPWFIGSEYVSGITLPGTYNTDKVHIYLKKFSPNTEMGLSIIVHEVFHALQYRDLFKSRGIGLLRLFIIHYVSNYIRLYFHYLPEHGFSQADRMAYELHPMEIPAYQQEYNFRHWQRNGKNLSFKDMEFKNCVCEDSGYKNPAGVGWLILGWMLGILMMLAKPFVELLFLILAGVLKVLGVILGLIRL